MPLMDITNPDIIKFLVESYDKTTRLRMKWNNIHGDKLKEAATLHRKEKGYYELDVLKESLIGGMVTTARDHRVAASNRRLKAIIDTTHINCIEDLKKGHSIADVGLGDPKDDPKLARSDKDLTRDPIMRPIDPKQRQIIYKDIPTYGRAVYLKSRYKMAPEEKFYFSECSGWDYGWRMGDSYFQRHAPTLAACGATLAVSLAVLDPTLTPFTTKMQICRMSINVLFNNLYFILNLCILDKCIT